MANYSDIKLTSLPEREMELSGLITVEKMAEMRKKALAKFKESVEIPGFRKGNAPEASIISKIGEMRILEEAAELALSEEYPNILEEHKIDALGRPEIAITKLAPENPLEFKAKISLYPEIKLSDYKTISKQQNLHTPSVGKKSETTVTEKEVDDVIHDIRQNIAHQKVHNENGSGKEHNHRKVEEKDLPEVNEEFAKMVGFANVSEMKEKIKENIAKEKEVKEKDKKRVEILEAIMKDSTINLPKVIIQSEQERMLAQFKNDIETAGVSYNDYLTQIKKTEEDLKNEWKETAVKRAKSQFVLNTIAKEEKIAPTEEDIKKEVDLIVSHHKDADRFRVRMYVENFLSNELVFQFLESQ